MIQEWLDSNLITVDDTLRPDKWACMMWPRLQLLRDLMKPGAVIFASNARHCFSCAILTVGFGVGGGHWQSANEINQLTGTMSAILSKKN